MLLQFDEVIGFVYQYIKLLRQTSPQEWVFKELQDIGNMDFRFAEEQPQDDYAVNLAGKRTLTFSYIFRFNYIYSSQEPLLAIQEKQGLAIPVDILA